MYFIAKDKPITGRKFKNELLKHLKKDLQNPFHSKKSIYFDTETYRDYVFKGCTTIFKIDSEQKTIHVIGVLKHRLF